MSSPSPPLPDLMTTCLQPKPLPMDEASRRGEGVVIDSAYYSSLSGNGFYEARDNIADRLSIALEDVQEDSKQIMSYAIGYVSLAETTPTTNTSSAQNNKRLTEGLEREREEGEVIVALSIVTREDIPRSRRNTIDVIEYSQALCLQVIHLLRIVSGDNRLHKEIRNSSLSSNKEIAREDTGSCAIFASLTLS